MTNTRLETKYRKEKTAESKAAYKKQKNYTNKLCKKEKKRSLQRTQTFQTENRLSNSGRRQVLFSWTNSILIKSKRVIFAIQQNSAEFFDWLKIALGENGIFSLVERACQVYSGQYKCRNLYHVLPWFHYIHLLLCFSRPMKNFHFSPRAIFSQSKNSAEFC